MSSIIIVSNRLPVSVRKTDGKLEFYPSDGGLATSMSGFTKKRGTVWVGWPGIVDEDLTDADKRHIKRELAKHHCVPVFMSQASFDGFYNGYSNSVLWPHLHNMPVQKDIPRSWWNSYKEVNELFCNEVIKHQGPKSKIWIHDYQLFLLPRLLRKKAAASSIGFFLHIPVPKASNFIQLNEAASLVQGVLGADLVGFHTKGYAHDFLESVHALDAGVITSDQVILHDRNVQVSQFPIGIDYDKFASASRSRKVRRAVRSVRRKYRHKRIILTLDRLDPIKGIPGRLKAYHKLLETTPDLHGKVVMVMIAIPSRTKIDAYQELKREVETLIEKTNKTFGSRRWQPIDYRFTSIPFEELSALYQVADVAFIAPMIDGMNLVAKEYIASKSGRKGALILSQTAGAAEELADAILVNPKQQHSLVRALKDSLLMPQDELTGRLKKMQKAVAGNGVQEWAGNFMGSLRDSTLARNAPARPLNKNIRAEIVAAYKGAKHPLLLLDYDGVLSPFYDNPGAARPSKDIKEVLLKLATLKNGDVTVVSGRQQADLDKWFGDMPLTLASEHSAMLKRKGKDWKQLYEPHLDWKSGVLPIMQKFADMTPGASVEEKKFSLVWHYRGASAYYAQKNLVALRPALAKLAQIYGLGVHNGKKIVEVKPVELQKSNVVAVCVKPHHDFVLAIGDDYTDEKMFTSLPANAYTIKVGPGRTAAYLRLKTVGQVYRLLNTMSKTY